MIIKYQNLKIMMEFKKKHKINNLKYKYNKSKMCKIIIAMQNIQQEYLKQKIVNNKTLKRIL